MKTPPTRKGDSDETIRNWLISLSSTSHQISSPRSFRSSRKHVSRSELFKTLNRYRHRWQWTTSRVKLHFSRYLTQIPKPPNSRSHNRSSWFATAQRMRTWSMTPTRSTKARARSRVWPSFLTSSSKAWSASMPPTSNQRRNSFLTWRLSMSMSWTRKTK